MARQWFYKVMGEAVGPVSSTDLKALAEKGKIEPDTPVRTESSNWTPAEKVRGLFATPVAASPLFPEQVSAPSNPAELDAWAAVVAEVDQEATTQLPYQSPLAATKNCPYCSEIILATANKCKHCGE
jgi:GYF domain 2